MIKSKLMVQVIASDIEYNTAEFKEYESFIATLFGYRLPILDLGKTKKVLIELFRENDVLYVIPDDKNELLYTIRKSFDFVKFNLLDDFGKKRMLSEAVRDAFIFLFNKFGWDYGVVEAAHDEIVKGNFQSQFILMEPKYNRTGNLKATIIVEHFLKDAMISLVFFNAEDRLVKQIDLFKTLPSHFFYGQLLGATKWLSNTDFQMANKSKEFFIKGSVEGNVSISYSPKQRDVEGVREEFKFLTTQRFIEI